MVFGSLNESDYNVKLKICNVDFERVSETKFLGVVIDQKLTWKQHTEYIKGKISKSLAILYKSRNVMNSKALHLIYYSLIVPYISYCVELWGSIFKTAINSILKLQKRAICIINKADYYAHTEPLFLNSHVMKFYDLFYYKKKMQIMFRAKLKILPDSIQRFFSIQDSPYNLRGACKFTVQKAKKGMKRRCVSIIGVKFWNDANINLKTSFFFDF